jgi:hypothetical protein
MPVEINTTKDQFVDGSTNKNYTAAEKTKLSGIAANANNYVHPGSGTNPHGTTKADIGLSNVPNLAFSGSNTGDETVTTLGTKINGATAKTTPVDADKFSIWNSVGGLLESVTWANIKTVLKIYFDGIYSTLGLGEASNTAYRGDRGKTAYDHSQITHAPTNAQKNSDITKAEIEAKLIGNDITSHMHPGSTKPLLFEDFIIPANSSGLFPSGFVATPWNSNGATPIINNHSQTDFLGVIVLQNASTLNSGSYIQPNVNLGHTTGLIFESRIRFVGNMNSKASTIGFLSSPATPWAEGGGYCWIHDSSSNVPKFTPRCGGSYIGVPVELGSNIWYTFKINFKLENNQKIFQIFQGSTLINEQIFDFNGYYSVAMPGASAYQIDYASGFTEQILWVDYIKVSKEINR